MNWALAIARNRAALLRIVAVLFVMAGLDEGGADAVPRRVWRRILRLLRPAEAAARRLIVIAARGIEVEAPKPRPQRPPTGIERLQAAGLLVIHEGISLGLARAPRSEPAEPAKSAPAIPGFRLADPPRRFDAKAWDGLRPFPQDGFDLADPDEEVSARHLCRRIVALNRALDDLDGQALRLARWKARRERDRATARPRRFRPLRPGLPPGWRRRPRNEIEEVLKECHALALHAWDTS
ncbi:MAG: hypothetical protein Kow0026_14150 [Oricola sp.]